MRTAVLIPCYNEEAAVAAVVNDFRAALPDAEIYVFDNNSTDATVKRARAAGAYVRHARRQGKGNVVRAMFADIEADLYVLVDGDDTYDAASAPALIERLLDERLDMVVGRRVSEEIAAYRAGHRFGNWLLTSCVKWLFGSAFTDILSGYRVFSRRYVKSFPALSEGFETETELTVHALELRMPVAEVDTPYKSRMAGSASKLNTYRDGARILLTILKLFRVERPLALFGAISLICGVVSLALALPLVMTFLETGLVPRLPTAVLATGAMLSALIALVCGVVLDTVTRGRHEMKRLVYLGIPWSRDEGAAWKSDRPS